MKFPQALADLLNKNDPDFIVFAHMLLWTDPKNPDFTCLFRVSAHKDFMRFRVEQLIRTNKDNLNPQGSWRTVSAHSGDRPGEALGAACQAAIKAQKDFIEKINSKINARVDAAVKRQGLVSK